MNYVLLPLLSLLFCAMSAMAQPLLPSQTQASLLSRIYTYDERLREVESPHITLLIVYQQAFLPSLQAAEGLRDALRQCATCRIWGKPIVVHLHALRSTSELDRRVTEVLPHIVYVAPMRSSQTRMISTVTRAKEVSTFTPVEEYVREGLGIGITLRGNQPEIVINLTALRLEKVQLSPNLLSLSRILNR